MAQPTARPPRASGRTFTEAERLASYERTERLSLRLRPGTVAALRARAESAGLSLAELVETLGLQ